MVKWQCDSWKEMVYGVSHATTQNSSDGCSLPLLREEGKEGVEMCWVRIYWVLMCWWTRKPVLVLPSRSAIPVGQGRFPRGLFLLMYTSQRKADTQHGGNKSRALAGMGVGVEIRIMGKYKWLSPHGRTTEWKMISGVENGLSHPFQKYLRAYSVPGRDSVIETESPKHDWQSPALMDLTILGQRGVKRK